MCHGQSPNDQDQVATLVSKFHRARPWPVREHRAPDTAARTKPAESHQSHGSCVGDSWPSARSHRLANGLRCTGSTPASGSAVQTQPPTQPRHGCRRCHPRHSWGCRGQEKSRAFGAWQAGLTTRKPWPPTTGQAPRRTRRPGPTNRFCASWRAQWAVHLEQIQDQQNSSLQRNLTQYWCFHSRQAHPITGIFAAVQHNDLRSPHALPAL